jgi:hypothetical protein
VANRVYYANKVPDAVVSGAQQLLEACDAWPHQTTPPNLPDPHIASHLSVCYVARHPNALNDQVMTGVVWGVLTMVLVLGALLTLLLAVGSLRRRTSLEPASPSLKIPLKLVIETDRKQDRMSRISQDLDVELSLDARSGGRKHSLGTSGK